MSKSSWRKIQAWEHIVSQMHEKPNFEKLMRLIADQSDNHVDILTFLGSLTIENATNVWLDLIGDIVGQSRYIMLKVNYRYFAFGDFDDHPDWGQNAGGFGYPFFDPNLNALGETTRLNDADYRTLIYARIARNVGNNTLEGVDRSLRRIFGTNDVLVLNARNANYTAIIGSDNFSDVFKQILKTIDIFPRSAGVGVNSAYLAPENQRFFAFGEFENDPIVGSRVGGFDSPFLEKYEELINYDNA